MYSASYKQAYFISKTTCIDWQEIRSEGRKKLSEKAQLKLEWIIFYYTSGNKNAKTTASQFGITRKTFHKWLRRYNQKFILGLEEASRAPITRRKRQISLEQRLKIRSLRRNHLRYGKMKLVSLYFEEYQEKISSWKIQKVIEEDDLYYDKVKAKKLKNKQLQARSHKRKELPSLLKSNQHPLR